MSFWEKTLHSTFNRKILASQLPIRMQVTPYPAWCLFLSMGSKSRNLYKINTDNKEQCNSCRHLPLWLGPTFRHLYLCLDGREAVMVICEVTRQLPPIVLHSRVKSGVEVRHSIVNSKYYTIRGRGVYGVICNIVRLLSASRAAQDHDWLNGRNGSISKYVSQVPNNNCPNGHRQNVHRAMWMTNPGSKSYLVYG